MSDAYTQLADRVGYAHSAHFRRILEFLMTPEQAALVAELPKTPEELSEKLGMDVEEVKSNIDILFRKGVIFPRNFETLENPRFARHTMQLHDASQAGLRLDPIRHGKLFRLWEEFCDAEWDRDRTQEWMKEEAPRMRILPAYKAILNSPEVLPYEDVREIAKASPLTAVVSCTCRQRKETVGKKCVRSHDAVCIQFGRSAEYALMRGTGTRLSLYETLEMLDEVEEDGLVHTWVNNDAMVYGVMCNCCDDCCMIFDPMARFNVPPTKLYAKSRYEARVDQDLCTGDEVCVDRCQFDAITMQEIGGESKAFVDPDKCMGCGVCVLTCTSGAMSFELVRPKEHIPAVPAK